MMNKEYKHGWHIAMEYDEFPLGLNEDIVRAISAVKDEPEWLLDFRLRAYRRWLTMEEPEWSDNRCSTAAYRQRNHMLMLACPGAAAALVTTGHPEHRHRHHGLQTKTV